MTAALKDIMMRERPDRRLLPNVPDKEGVRTNSDRRGAIEDHIHDRVKMARAHVIWWIIL